MWKRRLFFIAFNIDKKKVKKYPVLNGVGENAKRKNGVYFYYHHFIPFYTSHIFKK